MVTKEQIVRSLINAGMDRFLARQEADWFDGGVHVADCDLDRLDQKHLADLVKKTGAQASDKGLWFPAA